MNSEDYKKLLEERALPDIQSWYPKEKKKYILMHDNDGIHTAKAVQNRLQKLGVELLSPWPAHSPDLNPIENAWSMVEQHLEKVNSCTTQGLWQAMQDAWNKIDEGILDRLTSSLPRRLEEVIEADGGSTRY